MMLFVEVSVVGTLDLAVALRWDDDFGSRFSDLFVQVVGVIAVVGDRGTSLKAIDEIMGKGDIVALSGAGDQANR